MTKEEAHELFKNYLASPCPVEDCNAPADELCNKGAVWIHLERMTSSMSWKEV